MADDGRHHLLMALLDAIERYHRLASAQDVEGRGLFQAVREWFVSGDRQDPRAFESICAQLGFDPARIRGALGPAKRPEHPGGRRC